MSLIDWLLNPAVGLAVFLALIYTLGMHVFMGLGWRGLLRHWLLAIVGMAGGVGLALRANSRLPELGDLHVIEASAVALALLLLAGLRAKLRAQPA